MFTQKMKEVTHNVLTETFEFCSILLMDGEEEEEEGGVTLLLVLSNQYLNRQYSAACNKTLIFKIYVLFSP